MVLMEIVITSNWQGIVEGVVGLRNEGTPAAAASAYQPIMELSAPLDGAHCACALTIRRPQLVCTGVVIVSNARSVELSVQHTGDSTPSYVCTARAQPTPDKKWFQAMIDLKGLPGWELLQLKLLSLQGDRKTCTVCELCVITCQGAGQQSSEPAAAGGQQAARLVSQMDELRLLNQHMWQPDAAAGELPESLQVLYSKAMQQPAAGSSASMLKPLSALVAQGMLKQAQQKQQRQQQQQESMVDSHHPQPAWQQAPAIVKTLTAASLEALSGPPQGHVQSSDTQAVLLAVQRLESKLDSFTDKIMLAVSQIDRRLATLEQHWKVHGVHDGSTA